VRVQQDDLTDFRWQRFAAGYTWKNGQPRPNLLDGSRADERVLVSVIPGHEPQSGIEYSPLRTSTGLFRRLAETTPDEPGILAFATDCGFLGGSVSTPIKVEGESFIRMQGEALSAWRLAIDEMRILVTIWDSATNTRSSRLRDYIHWKDDAVLYQVFGDSTDGLPYAFELIASSKLNPEIYSRFTPGDLSQPAMYFLQRRVNHQLAAHAVAPKLLWHPQEGKLVIRLSTNSLIGVLWLQFAKAIEGSKKYQQCQNCREWIEVGGNRSARSDKKFCSPSCKSAAHRRMKQQNEATRPRDLDSKPV
jgi:hypothetical protein